MSASHKAPPKVRAVAPRPVSQVGIPLRDRKQVGAAVLGGRACYTVPNGALWRMSRHRDTKVMFAVRYEDGRSACIRVSPEAARYGHLVVMSIAREQQKAGDIPDGPIVSVQQVR